jgi:hypothetical protein
MICNYRRISAFCLGTAVLLSGWKVLAEQTGIFGRAASPAAGRIAAEASRLSRIVLQTDMQVLVTTSLSHTANPHGGTTDIREMEFAVPAGDARMRSVWNESTGELMMLSVRNTPETRKDLPDIDETAAASISGRWLGRLSPKGDADIPWSLRRVPTKIGNRYTAFFDSGDRHAKVVICAVSGRLFYVRLRKGSVGEDQDHLERLSAGRTVSGDLPPAPKHISQSDQAKILKS